MGIFSFLKRKKTSDDGSPEPEQANHQTPGNDQGAEPERAQTEEPIAPLANRLGKTRSKFRDSLANFFRISKPVDAALLEELESELIMADVGVDATQRIMDSLEGRVARSQLADSNAVRHVVRQELLDILSPVEKPLEIPESDKPFVILVVGVNGSGKTTTIGKLAKQLTSGGMSVMLAAGDTFRAAAVEQLQMWGDRNDVTVVSQGQGADSASVIFDALQSATARNIDVLIADTAGRLHTQDGLMEELKKVKRVLGKIDPQAPHETLLVLDGGTGQNALNQAEQFNAAMDLSGITLTKLDGTARGGIVFAVAQKLGIPLRFIGVGEAVDDLRVFQAEEFVNAIVSTEETSG